MFGLLELSSDGTVVLLERSLWRKAGLRNDGIFIASAMVGQVL